MLRWLGVGPGDEVIVPAYTYCATANVVIHTGATPVMVDVGEDFCMSAESLSKAITHRTKAVLPVDMGGLPVDYASIKKVIHGQAYQFVPENDTQKKLGRIAVFADSAHSIGARIEGAPIGTQADAMVFSFHAVKNLTTAEGGAISLNLPEPFDVEELYKWLAVMSLHGQSKDALAKTQKGSWEYDVEEPGWKCNMTDLQAAIGLVELDRYDADTVPKRKYIIDRYMSAFSEQPWAILPTVRDENRESSYHLFLLRIDGITRAQRDDLVSRITSREVSVNVHYKPLPLLTAYRKRDYSLSDYPVTESLWVNEVSLPVYYDLTDDQIDKVVEAVVKSVEEIL